MNRWHILALSLLISGCLTEERQEGIDALKAVRGASEATSNAAVEVVSQLESNLPPMKDDLHAVSLEAIATMRKLRGKDESGNTIAWYRRPTIWLSILAGCILIEIFARRTGKSYLDISRVVGKHVRGMRRELWH